MTNPLFSRLTVHRQRYQFDTVAHWVPTLPNFGAKENDAYVLTESTGIPPGLYIHINNVFRHVIPIEAIVDAFRSDSLVDLYYDLRDPTPVTGDVYTNGVKSSVTTLPIGAGGVHGTVTAKGGSGEGTVKSVNGVEPDSSGNVLLKQMIEYDISVPFTPNPDAVVVYQELASDMKYVSGSASSPDTPTTPIVIDIQVNGTSVGNITIGSSGAVLTMNLPQVSESDILTIVAPSEVEGLTMFSVNLTFERM